MNKTPWLEEFDKLEYEKEPVIILGRKVYIAQDNECFYAIRSKSPYFCFQARTREEVIQKAHDALKNLTQ